MKTTWFSIIAAVWLTGCGSGANFVPNANPEFRTEMQGKTIGETTGTPALWGQTEESVAKKITKGTTTKEEIKQSYGPTTNVSLTDTGEVWTYESTVTTIFSGASYTQNKLIILFNEKGIVKNYTFTVDKKQ